MKNAWKIMAFIILQYGELARLYSQQNLVPNPSFENYVICPDAGQISHAIPWFQPTYGTSDYLNSCDTSLILATPYNFSGFQDAHSGVNYAGIFASYYCYDSLAGNYREYIEVEMLDSLIPGTKYFVSFFISLSDSSAFATDDIGIYFSQDSIVNDTYFYELPYSPQITNVQGNYLMDKTGWMKISSSFVAAGGEKFITIGNFKNYQNTDTIAVPGGANYMINTAWAGGYYYIDDVCVSTDSLYASNWTAIDDQNEIQGFKIFPNPANEKFVIGVGEAEMFYSIYDCIGNLVTSGMGFDEIIIPSTEFKSGVYYIYIVTRTGSYSSTKKLIINH